MRHQLLPLLKSYNPRVAEALLRTAQIAGDDLAFLDEESARLWDKIAQEQEDTIILDKERFLELPSALKRHLLRVAIGKLLGTLKDIETRHIEGIMAALTKPAGRRISLPGGLIFAIEYNRYLLAPGAAALSPLPILGGEFALELPGKTSLPGWRIAAAIISREQMAEKNDDFTAYLDLDKTGNKLAVRSRQPGDRFQPLGLSQPKKLGEFMIDAKIPRAWRQRIPIVCSPKHILWVVGWRIDDRVKVSDATKQVLCLEFKQC
jgi:tRNA(Ile)-lysidine synthase